MKKSSLVEDGDNKLHTKKKKTPHNTSQTSDDDSVKSKKKKKHKDNESTGASYAKQRKGDYEEEHEGSLVSSCVFTVL